ncbi:MAG: leucine--tRNA ligase [Halobacteriaceae archaeon]
MTSGAGQQRKRRFDHTHIEPRWQREWAEQGVFRISDDTDDPAYILAMFPYTSGELHMGHVRNYAITDAYARFERLRGEEVLHPMGWDSFGLPAENAAEERDTNPREWTMECIDSMRDQLQSMGFGYDWDREITTCQPEYYRWNQWLFKRFMEADLVDRRPEEVNWCPSCETVLADEQVEGEDEVCWRCETPVEQRELDQWVFTITDYAEELLEVLDDLDGWPENVREMQRNWIGRQEGDSVAFELTTDDEVEIFTTRLDTIFGATFFVLSPGHDVAQQLAKENDNVAEYIHRVKHADGDVDETSGVFTGEYATNPATGEEIPVYVADYVLEDVGTGALYAVPAHDEHDHAFAEAHDISIKQVISPAPQDDDPEDVDVREEAYTEDGVLVNSGNYDGLTSEEARERFVEIFDGEHRVEFRLRDWLISRQRYWGTPIPMIECPDCGFVPVSDEDLPVELPEFIHTTGNPLDAATDWKETTCPECGGPAERETDTMDTFVDSSWYFFRFLSPHDDTEPFNGEQATDWMPVDQYVGGIEHAVMHLLYARFFTKVLDDLAMINEIREPFTNLTNQGMVLGEDGRKMSKSRGNGVSPQRIIDEYGADTARLFILEAAQPEKDVAWSSEGVQSAHDFLQNFYGLAVETGDSRVEIGERDAVAEYVAREVEATAATVTEEFEAFRFNHALQAIRELVSLLRRYREHTDPALGVFKHGIEVVAKLLAPVAPHVAEEVWASLDTDGIVSEADWPRADPPENYDVERRLIENTREDVRDIVEVAGIEDPESIQIVVAPDWKHRAHSIARRSGADNLVGELMSRDEFRQRGEDASDFAKDLQAEREALNAVLSASAELSALRRAQWLIEREFDATVTVLSAKEATDDLADKARPGRPAIQID